MRRVRHRRRWVPPEPLPLIGRGLFLRCWQPREITRFAGAGRWLGRPYAKRFISRRGVAAQSVASHLAVRPPLRTVANTHGICLLMLRAPPSGGTGEGRKRKAPQLMEIISQKAYAHAPLNHCITQRIRCQEESPRAGEGRGNFFSGRAQRALGYPLRALRHPRPGPYLTE